MGVWAGHDRRPGAAGDHAAACRPRGGQRRPNFERIRPGWLSCDLPPRRFYRSAFIHINLNTATREEILLVPGAGNRMAREFAEYRPWRTYGQFDKEIGKYVGEKETARLWRYVTIE